MSLRHFKSNSMWKRLKYSLQIAPVASALLVGVEGSCNWTRTEGEMNGLSMGTVDVDYPEIKVYFSKQW